jgi:hypothetical protein
MTVLISNNQGQVESVWGMAGAGLSEGPCRLSKVGLNKFREMATPKYGNNVNQSICRGGLQVPLPTEREGFMCPSSQKVHHDRRSADKFPGQSCEGGPWDPGGDSGADDIHCGNGMHQALKKGCHTNKAGQNGVIPGIKIQGDTRPTGAVPPRLPVSIRRSATLVKCSALLKGDGSQCPVLLCYYCVNVQSDILEDSWGTSKARTGGKEGKRKRCTKHPYVLVH